tara:strand:- start:1160 stop:1486 length:327 start_codon:yes stop_codon:yes gene_type:complete
MKNKILTASMIATLMGVYSASVYQISLDRLHENEVLRATADRPALSVGDRESDKQRILDVVQVREFVTVDSNLPVPGVECELNVEESAVSEEQINEDLSTCFETIQPK